MIYIARCPICNNTVDGVVNHDYIDFDCGCGMKWYIHQKFFLIKNILGLEKDIDY